MPSDLINFINNSVVNRNATELDQGRTDNNKLNYQFMYKQLESAVEEIIVAYPNDPIVNELKQKLVNNLKPILDQIQNGSD